MPAGHSPVLTVSPTPRTPAEVADIAEQLAIDYEAKSRNIMDGDGAYAGRLVDELTAALVVIASELRRCPTTSEVTR
jgi:Ran GTPase-activating protein (RanGAP) involved in mRNA processing and transport